MRGEDEEENRENKEMAGFVSRSEDIRVVLGEID